MAETKVGRDNYVNIQGWMITDLELKGNELILYAIIYGFSQAENQTFGGSLRYLTEWTNSTKQTVLNCLQSLIDKGYIGKNERIINGVKFCEYYSKNLTEVVKNFDGGGQKTCMGGGQKIRPNNIDINNLNNNLNNNTYVKVVESYHKICTSFPQVQKLTDGRKRLIRARLNQFSFEHIEQVFLLAEASDFLNGTKGKWRASFDWLLNESNFVKVLEGNYNNKPSAPTETKKYGGTYL